MGYLSTHVLDSAQGRPGKGIRVDLFAVAEQRTLLKTVYTNDDGRCDEPLLEKDDFKKGVYELVFHTTDYFRSQGVDLPDPAFLGEVVIRFGVASADEHYHVPLLIAPYSYSTYRGS
ncbi:hydroxyisourate hydrolase [Neptunomonas sp.]|uniref:hydroxyisourate hydrolase n=1 Tax=Neptunomonas sp. TaxID=1971898 RepID=UPI00356AB901